MLKVAVLTAVSITGHGSAFATSRTAVAVYQLDESAKDALRHSDLVIEGRVIGMASERLENIRRIPGRPTLFSMYRVLQVDVENVWRGWYLGGSISVVDKDQFDTMQLKAGDKVVFSANFNSDARRYVLNRNAFFVCGEHHRWWSQSPRQQTPLPYKKKELLAFSKSR
ncbi:MAG TPA: hypothetical protein VF247_09895 [Candidatus Krumholzibacteria bacterium]